MSSAFAKAGDTNIPPADIVGRIHQFEVLGRVIGDLSWNEKLLSLQDRLLQQTMIQSVGAVSPVK